MSLGVFLPLLVKSLFLLKQIDNTIVTDAIYRCHLHLHGAIHENLVPRYESPIKKKRNECMRSYSTCTPRWCAYRFVPTALTWLLMLIIVILDILEVHYYIWILHLLYNHHDYDDYDSDKKKSWTPRIAKVSILSFQRHGIK